VTGRRKLVKFQGCYHGWHDAVLMNVITPAEKLGTKDILTKGASDVTDDTIVCRFNDLTGVAAALDVGDVAAVILEPIPHNIGAVLPTQECLQGLRDLCTKAGTILIFDEVITGIRHGLGGYQAVAGVTPDLTTLGKAVANGYPAAAVAGPASLMDELGTGGGPVFFAGTFNGHPAAMAAMIATMDVLEQTDTLDVMFAKGERVRRTLEKSARGHGLAATAAGFGSVFVLYFMDTLPTCYEDTLANDAERYVAFHRKLIDRGHFLFPMNLKRSNVSAAHTDDDLDRLLEDADAVLGQLA
jgi:glutamate-1-semialdehyde 2,1-aminomutase